MVKKYEEEIAISLVCGVPMVGKTTWCREQQLLLPNVFIIPYDEMLYGLRATPNMSKAYRDVVANAVYDMVWELSDLSAQRHILVDGFPLDYGQFERFLQISNKVSVFQLTANHLAVLSRNNKVKKYNSETLSKVIYDHTKFFGSKDFGAFIEHYDVDYKSFNPCLKQSVLETIDD